MSASGTSIIAAANRPIRTVIRCVGQTSQRQSDAGLRNRTIRSRRCRESWPSWHWSQARDKGNSAISSFMRTRAQPRAELESPRAPVPYAARCEFSPTTTLRPGAQTKYQARHPAAYCGHRSPTKHPVPPTTTQRDRPVSIDLTIVNRTIPFQISPSSLP